MVQYSLPNLNNVRIESSGIHRLQLSVFLAHLLLMHAFAGTNCGALRKDVACTEIVTTNSAKKSSCHTQTTALSVSFFE